MRIPMTEPAIRQDSRIRGEAQPQGERTARALAGVAQSIGSIGNDMIDEEIKQKQAADRLAATRALREYESAGSAKADEIAGKLRTGEIASEDDAIAEYQASLGELDAGDMPAVGQSVMEDLKYGRETVRAKLSDTFGNAMRRARVDRAEGDFTANLDAVGKMASATANIDELSAAADAAAAAFIAAGGDSSRARAITQTAKDRYWVTAVSDRVLTSRDDMKALSAIERDLSAEDGAYYSKLDGEKRLMLRSQVISAKDRLQARTDAAIAKRDASAARAVDEFRRYASSGFPVPAELRAATQSAVKGTEHEGAFVEALGEEEEIRTVLSMPVDKQQEYLAGREQALRSGKSGGLKDISLYNNTVAAVNNNIKAITETPIEWAEARTGVSEPTLSPQLFLNDDGMASAVEIMRGRVSMLDAARKTTGVATYAPLKKIEAQQLGAAVKAMAPTKRAEFLGVLYQSFGDADVFRGAVGQMLGDDPRALAAGIAYGQDYRTTANRSVGELIERGSAILRDKSVIVPKAGTADDGTRAAFNDYIANSIPLGSDKRETYYQSALAIYATMAADDSKLGRVVDSKMFQNATRIATGGVVEYNGQKFVPPVYGMSEEVFKDKMNAALLGAAQRNEIDFDLREMNLIEDDATSGRYFVWADASTPIVGKDGNPLTVEVR